MIDVGRGEIGLGDARRGRVGNDRPARAQTDHVASRRLKLVPTPAADVSVWRKHTGNLAGSRPETKPGNEIRRRKERGGSRRKSSAKHSSSGSDTRFSHRKLCLFLGGGKKPTLFSRLGKLFQLSDIKMVARDFFFFKRMPLEFEVWVLEGRALIEGLRFARASKILRVRPSTSAFPYLAKGGWMDGWMELQFCGRRATALIGRIPSLLRS